MEWELMGSIRRQQHREWHECDFMMWWTFPGAPKNGRRGICFYDKKARDTRK